MSGRPSTVMSSHDNTHSIGNMQTREDDEKPTKPVRVAGARGMTVDPVYYYELITIQVEDCLFRIPKQYLEQECRIFKDAFSLPATQDTEGSCDANPFRLDGVSKGDFRAFLQALCQKHGTELDLQESQWIAVLELAIKWESPNIRAHAIASLDHMLTTVNKITLGRRLDIHEWVVKGYVTLVERENPLTEDEGKLLGMDDVVKIAKWREKKMAIETWNLGRSFEREYGQMMNGVNPSQWHFDFYKIPYPFKPYMDAKACTGKALEKMVRDDLCVDVSSRSSSPWG